MPALLGKKNDSTQPSNNGLPAKIQELTQSLNNEKDRELCEAICKKVTKERHHCPSPKRGDRVITKCIGFFEDGADPKVLSGLAESLSEQIESEKLPKKKEEYQKYYKYYIENFLPALKDKVMGSEKLAKLPAFNKETEQSQGPETRKGEIVGIILGITNKENDKNHPNNTIRNQGPENLEIDDEEELGKSTETRKLNGGPDSPVPSEKNPPQSPVSSRRSSVSLSYAEEDDDPQKEETKQPKQPAKEEPKKQENENPDGQVYPAKEEPKIPVSATLMTDDDHTKDPVKSKETERKNTIVQKPFANGNNSEDTPPEKQPNNRNFIALATCCALSVGCLIAGVVTLGMVGAGLLVMSVVFAIAAAVTRYLTPPSSKLTSTDLSPLIDDSKQR